MKIFLNNNSFFQAMDVVQDGKRSLPKGAHVRFSHVEVDGAAQAANAAGSNPEHLTQIFSSFWCQFCQYFLAAFEPVDLHCFFGVKHRA